MIEKGTILGAKIGELPLRSSVLCVCIGACSFHFGGFHFLVCKVSLETSVASRLFRRTWGFMEALHQFHNSHEISIN